MDHIVLVSVCCPLAEVDGVEFLDALQIQRAAGKTEGGGELELPAELCGRQPPAVAAYPASACVPKGFTTACTIIIPIDTVDC